MYYIQLILQYITGRTHFQNNQRFECYMSIGCKVKLFILQINYLKVLQQLYNRVYIDFYFNKKVHFYEPHESNGSTWDSKFCF